MNSAIGINRSGKPGLCELPVSDTQPSPGWGFICATCRHTWPDEEAMRAALDSQKWRNKKHTLMYGVVDEYTAGGNFRVVQYNESEAT